MCRAVTCRVCAGTTWTGCGRHVEQVMRGVPAGERCPGDHGNDSSAVPGLLARWLRRR